MPPVETVDRSNLYARLLLLVFSVIAVGLFLNSSTLITPYPDKKLWFESTALFPKAALTLMAIGGVIEFIVRRHTLTVGESEELDSSAANVREAVGVLVLFVLYAAAVVRLGYLSSTVLFLLLSSAWLRLGWRIGISLSLGVSLMVWLIFVKALRVYFGHVWLI